MSFHWNALLPPWVAWRSVVEEFLSAKHAARNGDLSPLRTWVTETLGEPWEDELGVIDDFAFLQEREEDYGFDDPWPEERRRFMAADKQESGGEHYWWVVRGYGDFGKSRLIAYGRANSEAELEAIRDRYKVKPIDAMMDSAFKQAEVFRFCLKHGWKPFRGLQGDMFVVQDEATGQPVRRIWRAVLVDPFYGTRNQGRMRQIYAFQFVDDPTKDLLFSYMAGKVGEWTLPRRVGVEYLRQVTAETREERVDAHGRVTHFWRVRRKMNHLLDCEKIILIAAIATKTVASGRLETSILPTTSALGSGQQERSG